ncbi:MAG: CCA tRNA nucleotidyltransferase [Christensenellales bacterium]
MRFPLPPAVKLALARLQAAGHEAYLVGGCVRDDLLGIPPHEYDICTSAKPEAIKACFSGERVIETGIRHGTVTVMLEGLPLEITTFRVDGSYADSRHPDAVSFSASLQEDLRRRDFTCNAMAWSEGTGLVDPYGGQEACREKMLTAVGDAQQRFGEDALRILRALRFASTLRFSIAPETYQAMLHHRPRLALISRERIARELNGLLLGKGAAQVLRTWPRIFFSVLPELEAMQHCPQRSKYHIHDVWEHTLQAVAHTPPDLALRWAALLHDSGTTHFRGHVQQSLRLAGTCLEGLRQPRRLRETVCLLILHHDDRIRSDNLHGWLARLGLPLLRQLLLLQEADRAGQAPFVSRHAQRAKELIAAAEALVASGAVLSLKDLAIDGRKLASLGFPQNHLMKETLQYLLEQVIAGLLPNQEEALAALALTRLRAYREALN